VRRESLQGQLQGEGIEQIMLLPFIELVNHVIFTHQPLRPEKSIIGVCFVVVS
jgi:hypothetical protein